MTGPGNHRTDPAFDERLVAYVDGEMSPQEVREIEADLAQSAEAREAVRRLREGAALLRGAFAAPLHAEVPDRFAALIAAATDPAPPRSAQPSATVHAFPPPTARTVAVTAAPARPRRWPIPATIAASFAAAAVLLGAVYTVTDYRIGQEIRRFEAQRQQDRLVLEAAISRTLEKQVSGTSVAWSSPDGARRGEITPLRTFRNADGQWCREYRESVEASEGTQTRRGVACRVGEGEWRTRVTVLDES